MDIIRKINDAFHQIYEKGEIPEGVLLSKEQDKELHEIMQNGHSAVVEGMPTNIKVLTINGVALDIITIPDWVTNVKPCLYVAPKWRINTDLIMNMPIKDAVIAKLN